MLRDRLRDNLSRREGRRRHRVMFALVIARNELCTADHRRVHSRPSTYSNYAPLPLLLTAAGYSGRTKLNRKPLLERK